MSPLALPEQMCRSPSPVRSSASSALFAVLNEEKLRSEALEESLMKALTEPTPSMVAVSGNGSLCAETKSKHTLTVHTAAATIAAGAEKADESR
jgi:hypothetical protein